MSCCGQARAQASAALKAHARAIAVSPAPYGAVVLEYTGRNDLAVIGPATRTTYRFHGPGARVTVDGRDSGPLGTRRDLRRA
jgi:hypothetical protein